MKDSKRKWIERGVRVLGWDRKDLDRAYRDKLLRRIVGNAMNSFTVISQPEIMNWARNVIEEQKG